MGRIAPSSGALKGGTHLREEANEKWAGVLGEKLRGLSRGLLPAEEKRALGFSNHQIRLPGTVHPSNVSQCMYGRPRPFCSGSASLNIFSWGGSRVTGNTLGAYLATAPPFSYGSSFLPLSLSSDPSSSKLGAPTHQSRAATPVQGWSRPSCGSSSHSLYHTYPGYIPASPKWPGSGEWGRGSVGEVLVRMRLFRLLVRQLPRKEGGCQERPQTLECEPMLPPSLPCGSSV